MIRRVGCLMASLVLLGIAGCNGDASDEDVTSVDQSLTAQRAHVWDHHGRRRHHHEHFDPFCAVACRHKECGEVRGPGYHHECDCGDCDAPETCGGGGVPNQCGGGT